MLTIIRLVVACILLCGAAKAFSAQGSTLSILGFGTKSCGAFVNTGANSPGRGDFESWLGGYISAVNAWNSHTELDLMANLDLPALMVWMENYCRAHPLETFSVAARTLAIELIQKRKAVGK